MIDTKKSNSEAWENEFGRVQLTNDKNGLDKIIKQIGHTAAGSNETILPEALNAQFFIDGNELCINMSNGTLRYASDDGKFWLQTVSDPVSSCPPKAPATMMWTIARAANLEVLMRTRRMIGLPTENDVCPH